MLLLYADTTQAPNYTPEEGRAAMQSWFDLVAGMKAAGVYLSNEGLSSATSATTVRVRNGETMTSDGLSVETGEPLGGYILLNCKDRDEAVSWAAKVPYATFGSVEVRPVINYPEG
ncbi:MAG: hypothetical protein J2P36_01195 [Ktedonobacteraceae bacterium]|nr:hypothetical protein [Ktedonobacteraceae bacterium]